MSANPRVPRIIDGARRSDDPLPNYLHWIRRERWPAPAAACLLLDICPDSQLGRGVALCWHSDAHRVNGVRERLAKWAVPVFNEIRMVVEYVNDGMQTHSLSHDLYPPDFEALHPRTFLIWGRDKGFEIPTPLLPLVADIPSRNDLNSQIEKLTNELASLRAEHGALPSAETQRLRTLQRMVLAMAKAKYAWTPGGRNLATGENAGSIAADIAEQLGQSRRLRGEAIRDALNLAEEMFPGRKD